MQKGSMYSAMCGTSIWGVCALCVVNTLQLIVEAVIWGDIAVRKTNHHHHKRQKNINGTVYIIVVGQYVGTREVLTALNKWMGLTAVAAMPGFPHDTDVMPRSGFRSSTCD